ncbi:MAG: LysR family transcriptional regulator [Mucilaginibacter sp.]|nr:LysR family transcriptional regulator [Mucilaginibacter sp.]
MELQFTGKLYLEVNSERVIGPGRVELLERIHESGSIRQAAIQMKMSYRQAWQFINHMNTHFGEAIVISERGGKGGGNARVTLKGLEIMRSFKDLHERFREFLKENSKHIEF